MNSAARQIRFVALRMLSLLAAALLCAGWAGGASAEAILDHSLCHAASRSPAPAGAPPPRFSCSGQPRDYQNGTLWLRARIADFAADPHDIVLLIRNSRFDRIAVAFTYADGRTINRSVRGGAFAGHWRAGGQIAFEAPLRDAPLQTVTMRFDRPASFHLLRMRLLDRAEAALQGTALAATVAAALTLLVTGVIYNAMLALRLRRQFAGWQAAWAGAMAAWGAIWSQLHLFVAPGMAGSFSAQLCTALACLAITLAALTALTAIDKPYMPRLLRRITAALAIAVAVLGVPATFMRSGPIELMDQVLGFLTLAVLTAVAIGLGWAWRRGNPEAKTFVGAWSLPMTTLALIHFLDSNRLFWGGGSQLLVLFASAWQTLWLAAAASRSHARLRIDHDRARRAEAQAHELARRDPLTGLNNRRGFVEAVAPMLAGVERGHGPLALMLVDVDMFKRINDNHGHDAGDAVLAAIARRLERWEGALCTVARMGGEEFALMVGGLEGFALARFAESVRLGIAGCDHGAEIGDVTVSIGVAMAGPRSEFRQLYRLADEALYSAKRQGRDRVVIHGRDTPVGDTPVGGGVEELAQAIR